MRSLTTFQSFIHSSKGLRNWGSLPDEHEQSCSAQRPVQPCTVGFFLSRGPCMMPSMHVQYEEPHMASRSRRAAESAWFTS